MGRARASKTANSPAKQAEVGGGFAAALGEADGSAGSGTPPFVSNCNPNPNP